MLDLGTPDDFRGDPYGWLTNQMSHVLAGLGGAWLLGRLRRLRLALRRGRDHWRCRARSIPP